MVSSPCSSSFSSLWAFFPDESVPSRRLLLCRWRRLDMVRTFSSAGVARIQPDPYAGEDGYPELVATNSRASTRLQPERNEGEASLHESLPNVSPERDGAPAPTWSNFIDTLPMNRAFLKSSKDSRSQKRKRHKDFEDPRNRDNQNHEELGLAQLLEKPSNNAALASLLRRCGRAKALLDGEHVHEYIIKYGYDNNIYIANCLVLMYGNCGRMQDAQTVFDKILCPNSFSWSILIKSYAQNGSLDKARNMFSKMPQRDVVSWNTIIAACAQNRQSKEALDLYRQMQLEGVEPNKVTFLCALEACASLDTQQEIQELLTAVSQSRYKEDIVVGTALVTMYGKCGKVGDAWRAFKRMPQRDVVCWNAMIAAFAQSGHGKEALDVFRKLQLEGLKPTPVTVVCALEACASLTALEDGHEVHAASIHSGYEGDLIVGNALVNMYGKCGSLVDARNAFGRLPRQNVISWTAMIAACVQVQQAQEALNIFCHMQLHGIKPNKITFICALDACADLAALEEGLEIHAAVADTTYELDLVVGTALIHMYGKCGQVQNARSVFKRMPVQDVVSWNAMLTACAQNGHGKEVLNLFHQMQFDDRVQPNDVTFLCVLTACSHMGWVDRGRHYFMSIHRLYGIPLTTEHYVCMADLLGRAGRLDEAEVLISHVPFENFTSAWSCLLAASKIHGDLQRGMRAAEHSAELNPMDATPYVMLSNIYAAVGAEVL